MDEGAPSAAATPPHRGHRSDQRVPAFDPLGFAAAPGAASPSRTSAWSALHRRTTMLDLSAWIARYAIPRLASTVALVTVIATSAAPASADSADARAERL